MIQLTHLCISNTSQTTLKMNVLERTDPTLYSRMKMSLLFKTTKTYHRRRLKEKFLKYYKPWRTGNWTSRVSKSTLNDLRLHLSWELGTNTFHWNKYQVGNGIIDHYKRLGTLTFMIQMINNNHNR